MVNYRTFLTLSVRQKRIVGGLLIIGAIAGLSYVFYSDTDTLGTKFREIENATNTFLMERILVKDTVVTPQPLRDMRKASSTTSVLTTDGIVQATNIARVEAGLPVLSVNEKLSATAERKLQDMFFYQYFEHVSPSGVGAGELAKKLGYEYIVIGENLAMGNFPDDAALVKAWMESPGHRENILNTRYKEIGIAVRQGIYEGALTWIAVQEFALSLSDCIQPNEIQKKTIDTEKKVVESQEKELNRIKAEIDAWEGTYGPEYGAKVTEYNTAVREYNTRVVELKTKINRYNEQVANFNACAQGQ